MIDRIKGTIIEIDPTHVVVDVGGVGFYLAISLYTYEKVGRSKEFSFYTHLHVREDILNLYGFADKAEREGFRKLIGISGVGPKVGQAILSSLTIQTLKDAVRAEDWKRLTTAPGVGRKLAERMVIELRNAFGKEDVDSGAEDDSPGYSGAAGASYEAVQALITLGYNPPLAEKMVSKALKKVPEDCSVEDLLKVALKP